MSSYIFEYKYILFDLGNIVKKINQYLVNKKNQVIKNINLKKYKELILEKLILNKLNFLFLKILLFFP